MNRKLRAALAPSLVVATLLVGVLVPQAAHADDILTDGTLAVGTLAEYKWSSDTGYVDFAVGGFWIESRTDNSKLVFQSDGNLVLYTDGGRAVWQSRTYGRGAAKLALQSDGNVVVYRADGAALWASGVSRSFPSGTWSMVLLGTPSAPTITERNRLAGARDFWRIP